MEDMVGEIAAIIACGILWLMARKKNPAAVMLGRRGRQKKVAKGCSMMTPEKRKEIARKAAAKRGEERRNHDSARTPKAVPINLADCFPHIPLDHSGECCGCIRPVKTDERTVELRCNECGAVVGV